MLKNFILAIGTALLCGIGFLVAPMSIAQGTLSVSPLAQKSFACDGGDSQACIELGQVLRFGTGVAADEPRARRLFERACTLNNGDGCQRFARMQVGAIGGARDPVGARQTYEKGCTLDNALACYAFGYSNEIGVGGSVDKYGAASGYQRACEITPSSTTFCPKAREFAAFLPARPMFRASTQPAATNPPPRPVTVAPVGDGVNAAQCKAAATIVLTYAQVALPNATNDFRSDPTNTQKRQLVTFWVTENRRATSVATQFAGAPALSESALSALKHTPAAQMNAIVRNCASGSSSTPPPADPTAPATSTAAVVDGTQCRAAATIILKYGEVSLTMLSNMASLDPTNAEKRQRVAQRQSEINRTRAVATKFAAAPAPSPQVLAAMETTPANQTAAIIGRCESAPAPQVVPPTKTASVQSPQSVDARATAIRRTDAVEARRLFEQSCSTGSQQGCLGLGTMLYYSQGGPGDRPRARGLLDRACAANVGDACDSVGSILEYGTGVTADEAAARAQYQKACTLNSGGGCLNIGLLQLDGRGGAMDERAARGNFEKSCRLGDSTGCNTLASVRAGGIGGAVDAAGAGTAKAQACRLGLRSACQN